MLGISLQNKKVLKILKRPEKDLGFFNLSAKDESSAR